MNYATIKPLDVANGTGIRVSLFVSGCRNHCRGCFNPETWRFDYGEEFTKEVEDRIIRLLHEPFIKGLSLLGGDPFEPENEKALIPFLQRVKALYPDKDIWCYTGYLYENLIGRPMMKYIDVLVDGKFIIELKNPKLAFKGSENQRIIDLRDDQFALTDEEIKSLCLCKDCKFYCDGLCIGCGENKLVKAIDKVCDNFEVRKDE